MGFSLNKMIIVPTPTLLLISEEKKDRNWVYAAAYAAAYTQFRNIFPLSLGKGDRGMGICIMHRLGERIS